MEKTKKYQFCLECGKKIDAPFSTTFANESKFCDKCEVGDLEGKCSCSY